MALDLSTDYKAVDLPETIILHSMFNSGSAILLGVTAFRSELTFRELHPTGGVLIRLEGAYDVPITLSSGYDWKPGDYIMDSSGNILTIFDAKKDETTAFWRLIFFDPKIAHNFCDTCTIKVATDAKETTGTRTATFTAIPGGTNVDCRIQPSTSMWSVNHGKVGTLDTFDVYLGTNYDIYPDRHVIQWTHTVKGLVTGDIRDVQMQRRIDECMMAVVELRA